MTVDCTNIESILGPLRQCQSFDGRMISLTSLSGLGTVSKGVLVLSRGMSSFGHRVASQEETASSGVKWTSTDQKPVSDWLGNVEGSRSHDEILRRMRIAAFIAFMDFVAVLAEGHPWCLLDHQAAGHACFHVRFIGRRILLKPAVEAQLLEIAKHWYNRQVGPDAPSLSQLMEYRAQLQRAGLDCNRQWTYRYLKEAFYPIDLSQAVVDEVCLQPFILESVLGRPRPLGTVEHYATLVIVAPNSD
jgi:hypothetical protein